MPAHRTRPERNHPRDEQGRVLPDESWPPGKQAPGALEAVRRFVNTVNRENGADRFGSPAALDAWLVKEESPLARRSTPSQWARAVELRDALRVLVATGSGERYDTVANHWPLVATSGGVRPAARAGGVDSCLGALVATVATAMADGTWLRLKACANGHCQWLYYDRSKNGSGTWCSMTACGERAKASTYRRNRLAPGNPGQRR